MKPKDRILDGVGLMAGMIIGAGFFVLPFAVAQAGWFWGLFHFFIAFIIVTLVHVLYGEAIYSIEGRHRLPGYARITLGKSAANLASFATIFGFFGFLLAYGLLAGIFLNKFLPGVSVEAITIIFFLVAPLLLLLNIREIGYVSFLLTIPLVAFVLILAWIAFPEINFNNFVFANNANWFLPYGIFLFAMGGASVIPEVAEVFRKREGRKFELVLIFGTLLPAVLYALFAFVVVGVSGPSTTADAITGLEGFFGRPVILLGAAIGAIAVLTSYISLGIDLKNLLHLDHKFGNRRAWLVVSVVPLLLYLFGATSLIDIIGVVGSITVGVEGIIILMLAQYVRRHHYHPRGFMPIGNFIPKILIVFFIIGIIWQIGTAMGLV